MMKKTLLLIILTAGIIGCTPDVTTERADENGDSGVERAVLTIRLGNGSDTASSNGKAMTVVPSPSLIKSYRVTMTNGSVTKTYNMDSSSGTFYDLPTGSCSITVNGYSGTGQSGSVIASGSTTATLAAGGNSVNITMSFMQTAVTGKGSYSLTVEFPAGAANGLTYSFNGEAFTTASVTVSSTITATITGSNITSGSYDLVLKFTKGGATTGVYREAVNIYDNVISNKWINPDGSLADKRVFGSSDFADTNASLAGLTTSLGAIGFVSGTLTYDIYTNQTLSLLTLSFSVTPIRSVSGQHITYLFTQPNATTTSGSMTSGNPTTLYINNETTGTATAINITVTAPDGSTTKTYTITVHYDSTLPAIGSFNAVQSGTAVNMTWSGLSDTGGSGLGWIELYMGSSFITMINSPAASGNYLYSGSFTNGTPYTFHLKVYDRAGNCQTSTKSVTYDSAAPGNVTIRDIGTGSGSTNIGDRQITLAWSYPVPPTDIDHLEITYGANIVTIPYNAAKTNHTITGLTNGNPHNFTIKSVDAYGNKSTGVTINSLVPFAAVSGIKARYAGGKVYLTWTKPANMTGITGYLITYGSAQTLDVTDMNTTSADFNIIDSGKITIQTKYGSGNSNFAASPSVNFTIPSWSSVARSFTGSQDRIFDMAVGTDNTLYVFHSSINSATTTYSGLFTITTTGHNDVNNSQISINSMLSVAIAVHPITNEPYIIHYDYSGGTQFYVKKFTGVAWSQVGKVFNPVSGSYPSITINRYGAVYVSLIDTDLNLYSFDGSDWPNLGIVNSGAFVDVSDLECSSVDGKPHEVFIGALDSGKYPVKINVDGGGSNPISGISGIISGHSAGNPVSIDFDADGNYYVAYTYPGGPGTSGLPALGCYSQKNNANLLGGSIAVSSSPGNMSLAVNPVDKLPYIAYISSDNKVHLLYYNGSNFEELKIFDEEAITDGFNPITPVVLQIDSNGVIYVGYIDNGSNLRVYKSY